MLKKAKAKKEINTQDTEILKLFRHEYFGELRENLADQKKLMEMKYENFFYLKIQLLK
jgi:hypothetical protein